MTRIYQLDTIETSSLDSTYLTVGEDSAGDDTVRITLGQLVAYLFNLASTDNTNPFNNINLSIGYSANSTGEASIAIGYGCVSSQTATIAIGIESTASAPYSNTIGFFNTASAPYGSAFGSHCTASGVYSNAIGHSAMARVNSTTNISGPIILRGDNGDNFNSQNQFMLYSGVQNVFMTGDIDFVATTTFSITAVTPTATGTGYAIGDTVHVNGGNNDAILTVTSVDGNGAPTSYSITAAGTNYTALSNVSTTIISSGDGDGAAEVNLNVVDPIEIDLPFNCVFYPDEVGVILVNPYESSEIMVQPIISFGNSSEPSLTLLPVQTTNLINYTSREIFSTLRNYDGLTSLTFSVNSPATAGYCHGRAYWKGMLVENTPPSS